MPTPASLEDAPLIADRYRVVRELGAGGMGVVYEVIDEKTNRRRALKRIRAHAALDAELVRRFEHEVTVAGRVESDHVVEVFDAGIDPSTQAPYIVMELLTGEDLGALLAREGGLEIPRALGIFEQLARGLERTHAEGIVHRDIKPENVFLAHRDDGSMQVKVLDFGVAKTLVEGSLSPATTRVVGTPLYMAPEQFTGDGTIDARADVYALGQLAFTLLVGSPYFDDERKKRFALPSLAVAIASPDREPASARAGARGVLVPAGFDVWFRKATAPEPEDRFASADEALASLRTALEGPLAVAEPTDAEPALVPPAAGGAAPSRSIQRRSRVPISIAGAVAIALLAWGLYRVSEGAGRGDETRGDRETRAPEEIATGDEARSRAAATTSEVARPGPAKGPSGMQPPRPATDATSSPGGAAGPGASSAPVTLADEPPASPAFASPPKVSPLPPKAATTVATPPTAPAPSASAVPYDPLEDL